MTPSSSELTPDSGPVPEFTFARADIADCNDLAALARNAHSHPWSAGQYRDSLNSGHTCWVLRAKEGQIAACCVTSLVFDEVEILDVAVAPQWRRRGLGAHLLQQVLEQLPEDIARVLLEVRASNRPARGLYHKLGFSEDGRRKNYYPKADGSREDALLMSLIL
ncbi:ribosomal protein S18-alanine N-acetyltransferase [Microbulbifer sp. ALW1]|uniref:ribosomal protein S18-alanine N-acetyltransferase n=1 Tax=Microbulbifer sp. (strain ALW1) TaxID=1516059 RepID=UPI001357C31B|nr:ribosomal protein S18-alanine N-acetyltransferase [Microbulbifer sp. ALW1]